MPLPDRAVVGQAITAAAWNKIIAEIKRVSDLVVNTAISKSKSLGEPALTVLVKNSSGAERNKWDILGIDGQLYVDSPVQDQERVLNGITPTTASHTGKYVILKSNLIADGVGEAYIAGACMVRLDVVTDTFDYAEVKDGDCTQLSCVEAGTAQIIWKESGTGTKWAIVRFPSGGAGSAAGIYQNPKDLTYEGLHTDGTRGTAAQWDRNLAADSPPNYEGVIVTVCVGMSYNPEGALKTWVQDLLFDSAGMLVSISVERDSEVDRPVDCS